MAHWEFNPFPLPLLQHEECLTNPLMLDGFEYDWQQFATTEDRLYFHHTLSSIRQHHSLTQPCAPKDSLDVVLSSIYDHSNDVFKSKYFVLTQPDTVGLPTFRLLKNKRFIPGLRPARDLVPDEDKKKSRESNTLKPGTMWHGIRQGGLKEKRSVHAVKLGITSNHGSQSNRGFSRKVDGTFYSS